MTGRILRVVVPGLMRTLAALALIVMACSPTGPTSPERSGEARALPFALACWGVDLVRCQAVAAEAVARLPDDAPVVTDVSVHPDRVVAGFAAGAGLVALGWSVDGTGGLAFGPRTEVPSVAVTPASGAMAGAIVDVTLGHCGLGSPIDVDGALWDPDGPVDPDAPEAINPTIGSFRRVTQDHAEFTAPGGFRVTLLRRTEPKSVALCD